MTKDINEVIAELPSERRAKIEKRKVELMTNLSEEERHAIEHMRFMVQKSDPEHSVCCFDYELVATALKVFDRAAARPAQPTREEIARKLMEFDWHKTWELSDAEHEKYLQQADQILRQLTGKDHGPYFPLCDCDPWPDRCPYCGEVGFTVESAEGKS